MPNEIFCRTTVILDDDTTRLHQDTAKNGNRKLLGFTGGNGKQNPVASLISSTLPTKLKLKTFYPSGSKLQPINVSKFSNPDKKNGATRFGGAKKSSRKKPLFSKSKSAKTLLQDDEEVLNESSDSDIGDTNQCDLSKRQNIKVSVTCHKCEIAGGTNLLPNSATLNLNPGCVHGKSAVESYNNHSPSYNNHRLKGSVELNQQCAANQNTSKKVERSSWGRTTGVEDDCTVT